MMYQAAQAVGDTHGGGDDAGLVAAGTAAGQAMRVREQLRPFADDEIPLPPAYPDVAFGRNLAALAAMLAAGLPIRCVSVQAVGGYDTHDGQENSLGDDLGATAKGILAFQRDLETRGLADRVVTLVWSEFGRRPEQNGSAGTDHGAAGLALLVGSRVQGQMVGEFPGLDQLDDDDNLRRTSDFRAAYCALVEQWFGYDAAAVIPRAGGFSRPQLIRSG